MTSTIQTKHLAKNYGKLVALKDFSFEAHCGEIIALLGPNGAGKSTLMNMISGFLSPSSGEILILNQNIKENSIFAKENIGFLPEGSPLYPDMSVKTFLNYMAELRNLPLTRVDEVAQIANIENVLHQKIETLSKGYLRRVGFAQSILSNPPILLLDEPTDGLDPNQKNYIRQLIHQMGKDKTIIISTHLLEEAEHICSRIILIDKGEIKADGCLSEILTQTNSSNLENAFSLLTTKED